ncbi:hypothetical protein BJ138DRAFT_998479 [Hygrophoropsis aurantiaca]|uniref:Uncharacterized protein n=1 Tax=Hygrophoropsis aurantiaca TaxID=72124 RepID=A0ACB8APG8_9AGAM|nr:hypothetical protein BJ138DRAFT_998479 [Hygrophoropsis aurantiaca]
MVHSKPANPKKSQRERLRGIAETTLEALQTGSVVVDGVTHDIAETIRVSNEGTSYYSPDDPSLSNWADTIPPSETPLSDPEISILEISVLEAARLLVDTLAPLNTTHNSIAVLNFASATRPGGGFISGAQAQEESIARSSTIYSSLMTDTAQQFYQLHKQDRKRGFYYHAMIWTPTVVVFRNDAGDWVEPFKVSAVTSAAVNAGDVRKKASESVPPPDPVEVEERVEATMRERMARVLFLLEKQGVKNVVLGSFGTGVFRNKVELVAKIWADLLTTKDARFKHSFHRVIFAIIGTETFNTFKQTFEPA